MNIRIVKITVLPEHAPMFQQQMSNARNEAIQEHGCLEMRLFVDNNKPNMFIVYERWETQQVLHNHMHQPHIQKFLEQMNAMLQQPVEVLNLEETIPAPLYENNPKSPNPEDEVFIIFFIFKIKEGYREQLLKQFEKHVAYTRQEEGCILFDLYTVNEYDDTLAVYEHWRKESDVWDIHFKQEYSVETGALMHKAVDGEMEQYMNFVTEIA